jgi:hypothetical protein
MNFPDLEFLSPLFIAGVVAGLAALFVVWWLWWRLPKRQVDRLRLTIRDPKARADVEDNFRKTIGQLLGGAAVLIGAGLAYLQFTQQQRAAHDLLISNQVSKGFELLGSKDKEMMQRLGGIYALEGVLNTSEQYHQPVLEALSAFVRDGTRNMTDDGPPATDIQAALTVIRRRKAIGPGSPDLGHAHIPKANLFDVNLSGANLDYTNLHGANLSGAHLSGALLIDADLSGADLYRADLSGAGLSGANLDDTNLHGASLNGANLSGAYLVNANLSGASLSCADLRGAHVTLVSLGNAQTQFDTQFAKACGLNAKLDPGLTPLKRCALELPCKK